MMNTNKTGIVLFVYKRPQHTSEVLEGLRKNSIEKLYIIADGPKEADNPGDIEQVHRIIDSVDWCKTEIIKSPHNRGLSNSRVFGVNYVLDRHERIIVIEDDCVPAEDFISFMVQCLDQYESEEKVMNIVGYAMPFKMPKKYHYDTYFTYRSGAHGQAFWRRSWKLLECNPDDFNQIKESKKLRKKLDLGGRDLYYIFEQQMEGKLDSLQIWWTWSIIKNDGFCVNPTHSRIRNIGYDGSGVHCGTTDKYLIENIEDRKSSEIRFPPEMKVNHEINHSFNTFIHGTLWQRARDKMERIISA